MMSVLLTRDTLPRKMIKEKEHIIMKGFVKNEGEKGVFTLQRRLSPGSTLSFDDAYLTVGEQSGKKKGPAFVKWLRETCLTGNQWAFYRKEGLPYFDSEEDEQIEEKPVSAGAPAKGAGRIMRRKVTEVDKGSITPHAIIEAPFPQAHDLIEKCSDRRVLKKALTLSQHFSKKDEHMRHLMRRLQQVY